MASRGRYQSFKRGRVSFCHSSYAEGLKNAEDSEIVLYHIVFIFPVYLLHAARWSRLAFSFVRDSNRSMILTQG